MASVDPFVGIEREAGQRDDTIAKQCFASMGGLPVDPSADLIAVAKAGDAAAFWRAAKPHVESLATMYENDPTAWQAFRAEVKKACGAINVRNLDELVRTTGGGGTDGLATELADLAASRCELWHDPDGAAYASYSVDGHKEHWRIESRGFRDWLAWLAHSELHAAPASEVVKSVCTVLSGRGKFDGEELEPHMRAAHDDLGHWIDLGDTGWRAIMVTASGWRVVENPPVKFIRTRTTRPLPDPTSGGNVETLWRLVNIPERERLLVLTWLIECFRSDTPYALLELSGEQGAAKSSAQRILRELIDPSQVALRGRPKTVEDIFVGAANSHLLSFENLSGLSNDQSDALCTVCTGGGYSARQLYTNGEEAVLKAHCPVVLNGISPVVLRPDLLDRAISILLPAIEHRVTEGELQHQVTEAAPGVMGAILDLFSAALAVLPSVKIAPADLPRMADFAKLGEAIARVLGFPEGTFLELYGAHRRAAVGRTIEASPIASAIVAFVEAGGEHRGTVKNLLETLNQNKPEHEQTDYWPRSPKGLADAMRRYAPAFRQLGIVARVAADRRRDGIHCELAKADPRIACAGPKPQNNVHNVHKFTGVDVVEL
ncbi:MAG: hypothetical protein ACYCXT_08110 [Acidiferrobacteraceae bacterium]